jgi:phenylalanyl-tRNA synthetase beta chain
VNVPESWLRSFCNPSLSGRRLADKLTMAGLEVEAYAPVGAQLQGDIVVAEVLSVEKHPNADKLTVCRVRAGRETVQVVCGAPNVRPGMKAPLARVGVKAVRGIESHGMLASARELGLSEDHAGVLELPATAKSGSDARKLLGLDDHVMTFKLTPNRPDCLSVLGIAREVTALTWAKLTAPAIKPVAARSKAKHPFGITHAEGCGRFAGRVIRNLDAAAPSPAWIRQRLVRPGERSFSAQVDVAN